MSDTNDFNDETHRVESASAIFQKGMYHLFALMKFNNNDLFAEVQRKYQCIFLLCVTQLLLDIDYKINTKHISKRLKNRCKDPKNPNRTELDPAALLTHSIFENGKWVGFHKKHSLYKISIKSLKIYNDIVDARHNLIYRPMMLKDAYWEDCTLINLFKSIPVYEEIEQLYIEFVDSIIIWMQHVENQTNIPDKIKKIYSKYFLQMIFMVFKDNSGKRPSETIFKTYTRMLNPNDTSVIQQAILFRNKLLDIGKLKTYTNILDHWEVGKL